MPLALALALTLSATTAPPETEPRYHLALDLPVTVVAGGTWLVLVLAAPSLARTTCPCQRTDVPDFDRFAIDAHWSHGSQLANATVALSLAGSALLVSASAPSLHVAGRDLGIAIEATAIAGLGTEVAKIGISRPYPFLYRADATAAQQRSGINYASMWSGHTAVAMSAAVSSARLLDLRHAPTALRITAWIAGPLLAIGAGALEVSQANHFPSDVVVGAAAGALIGWGTVELHTP